MRRERIRGFRAAVVILVLAALLASGCATKKGARQDKAAAEAAVKAAEEKEPASTGTNAAQSGQGQARKASAGGDEAALARDSSKKARRASGGKGAYATSKRGFLYYVRSFICRLYSIEFWRQLIARGWQATQSFFYNVAVFFADPSTTPQGEKNIVLLHPFLTGTSAASSPPRA
jgi:predicted small secreted protein